MFLCMCVSAAQGNEAPHTLAAVASQKNQRTPLCSPFPPPPNKNPTTHLQHKSRTAQHEATRARWHYLLHWAKQPTRVCVLNETENVGECVQRRAARREFLIMSNLIVHRSTAALK